VARIIASADFYSQRIGKGLRWLTEPIGGPMYVAAEKY
jgi:hypothetical protein